MDIDLIAPPQRQPVPIIYGRHVVAGRILFLQITPELRRVGLIISEGPIQGYRLMDGKPAIFIGGEQLPRVESGIDISGEETTQITLLKWNFHPGWRGDYPKSEQLTGDNDFSIDVPIQGIDPLLNEPEFNPAYSRLAYLVIELRPSARKPGPPDANNNQTLTNDPVITTGTKFFDFRRQNHITFDKINVIGLYDGLMVYTFDARGNYCPHEPSPRRLYYSEPTRPLGYRIPGLNPAWCVADLLMNKRYGLGLDRTRFDWPSFVDAAAWYENTIGIATAIPNRVEFTNLYNAEAGVDSYVGYEFTLKHDIRVTRIGREFQSSSAISQHTVALFENAGSPPNLFTIMRYSDGTPITVEVGPEQNIKTLREPVILRANTRYGIGSIEYVNGDPFTDNRDVSSQLQTGPDSFGIFKTYAGTPPKADVWPMYGRQGGNDLWYYRKSGGGQTTNKSESLPGHVFGDLIFEWFHNDPDQVQTEKKQRIQQSIAIPNRVDVAAILDTMLNGQAASLLIYKNGRFILHHPPERPDINDDTTYSEDVERPSVFTFTDANVAPGSFREAEIDPRQAPNQITLVYRNLDNEHDFYPKHDPIVLNREEVIDSYGGLINDVEISGGNMTQTQALLIANYNLQRYADLLKRFTWQGFPDSLHLVPGAVVDVIIRWAGLYREKLQILNIREMGHGQRQYEAWVYRKGVWEENPQNFPKALSEYLTLDLQNPLTAVPSAAEIVLTDVLEPQGGGTVNQINIYGQITLIEPAVRARIYVRKFVAGQLEFDWRFIQYATTSFVDKAVEKTSKTRRVVYEYKVQCESLTRQEPFDTAKTASIEPDGIPGVIPPDTKFPFNLTASQIAKFVFENKERLIGLGQRLRTFIASNGAPWMWFALAVVLFLAIRRRILRNREVAAIDGPVNLSHGDILHAENSIEGVLKPGDTIWAEAQYLKDKEGPLDIRFNMTGSLVLQLLAFSESIGDLALWGSTVQTLSALPASDALNTFRIVRDVDKVYYFNGTSWVYYCDVLARREVEIAARTPFISFHHQNTGLITVTEEMADFQVRIEAGPDGLNIPDGETLAIVQCNGKFNPASAGTTQPGPTTHTHNFPTIDHGVWTIVHLDNEGSANAVGGQVHVSNGGSGDFDGTVDTGSGYVLSLPDSFIHHDDERPNYDYDFDVIVTLGTFDGVDSGERITPLIIRESNNASAACIGLRYEDGVGLSIFKRGFAGESIVEDSQQTPWALQAGDAFKISFRGARLSWYARHGSAAWTPIDGEFQNIIIDFPLAKLWLAAGSNQGHVTTHFTEVQVETNNPIEPPTPPPVYNPIDPRQGGDIIRGGRIINLIDNPSGQLGVSEGWDDVHSSWTLSQYHGQVTFTISGPQQYDADQVLRSQLLTDVLGNTNYIMSCFVSWTNGHAVAGDLVIKMYEFDASDNLIATTTLFSLLYRNNAPMRRYHKLIKTNSATVKARVAIVASSACTIPSGTILRCWGFQFEQQTKESQTEPTRPIDTGSSRKTGVRVRAGLDPSGFSKFTGRWAMKNIIFTDNTPDTHSVTWSAGEMIDGKTGQTYPITAGSTSHRFIYWDVGNTGFSTSATLPALIKNRIPIAKNVDGEAIELLDATFTHGDLLPIGGIKPTRIAPNTQPTILNPGYEIASDEDKTFPDGWVVSSNISWLLDTSTYASGTQSFKLTKTAAMGYRLPLWLDGNWPLMARTGPPIPLSRFVFLKKKLKLEK